MTQHNFDSMDPAQRSGADLKEILEAVLSSHSGPARPPHVMPGMMWVKWVTGGGEVYFATADEDALLGSFDYETLTFKFAGLSTGDSPTFGNLAIDGSLSVLKGVTGGGYGLRISRSGDRIYFAVTDLEGGFIWTREFMFDPADDCWSAEGGFKVKNGMITVDGDTFEKLALKRSDTNKHAGLFVHSDGLVSIRTDDDRTADKASAIFESSGSAVSDPAAVVTKEKGDARYALKSPDAEWRDVLASRVLDTAYQNTTGHPIMVLLNGSRTNLVSVSKDGVTWVSCGLLGQAGAWAETVSFNLPAGHFYKVGAGAGAVSHWLELY